MFEGDVHAPRPAKDVPEFQAGLSHRRVVDDRQKPRRVRHQHLVEKRLIGVQQRDQVDVTLQVRRLLAELPQDAQDLVLLVIDAGRQEPGQAQRVALLFGKGRGLVELRVVQDVGAALAAKRGGVGNGLSLLRFGGSLAADRRGSGHGFSFLTWVGNARKKFELGLTVCYFAVAT